MKRELTDFQKLVDFQIEGDPGRHNKLAGIVNRLSPDEAKWVAYCALEHLAAAGLGNLMTSHPSSDIEKSVRDSLFNAGQKCLEMLGESADSVHMADVIAVRDDVYGKLHAFGSN